MRERTPNAEALEIMSLARTCAIVSSYELLADEVLAGSGEAAIMRLKISPRE